MRNSGKPSEHIFENKISAHGKNGYFYRIPDAAEVRGRTGRIGYIRKTPSDYIVTLYGETFYAEIKSTVNPKFFAKSFLKIGQKNAARQVLAAGGQYLIFIHSLATQEWYRVPANVLIETPKTTFSWTELQHFKWAGS